MQLKFRVLFVCFLALVQAVNPKNASGPLPEPAKIGQAPGFELTTTQSNEPSNNGNGQVTCTGYKPDKLIHCNPKLCTHQDYKKMAAKLCSTTCKTLKCDA